MNVRKSTMASAVVLALIACAHVGTSQSTTFGSNQSTTIQSPSGPSGAESPVAPVSQPSTVDSSEPASAPNPQPGIISGTVLDTNGDLVPGATVVINTPSEENRRKVVANDSAAFQVGDLTPGVAYSVNVSANGFADWSSAPIVLQPGQYFLVSDIHLKLASDSASVTVYASTEQIATEQVKLEEQQRVFGFVPNYYVVYDSQHAAPLTPRLKFELAMKVATNPVTIAGVAFMAGINQAADTPNYQLGARGYGQRLGAEAADDFSDILIGGAILPSLLHQDPRYFYKGTGSRRSRIVHAVSAPFITRGDDGGSQVNYSSIGGDLASSALSMTYYPDSNRGPGRMFGNFAIVTAGRAVSALAQEFIFPRFTSRAKSEP